jgi:hypothetical protein
MDRIPVVAATCRIPAAWSERMARVGVEFDKLENVKDPFKERMKK